MTAPVRTFGRDRAMSAALRVGYVFAAATNALVVLSGLALGKSDLWSVGSLMLVMVCLYLAKVGS